MLHEVNWYTIAMTLRNFLRNYKKSDGSILFPSLVDRDDLIIRVGAGNTGEYPAIWILFGSEESLDKQDRVNGAIVQLWIDMYVKGAAEDGENDYDDSCYQQVYEIEQEITQLLPVFQRYMADNGIVMKLNPLAVLSDGDTNAPVSVSARYVLDIEWRKNRL